MNKLLSEICKVDVGLTSSNLNGPGTGAYFAMDKYRKALFMVEIGAMAAAATSVIQVMQATDAVAGGPAKVITNNAATITANTRVAAALLTSAVVHVAGDTYTVNGLTYTAAAADGGATSRTYALGADATASTANLAAKINSAIVGVPGVLAAANVGALTLTADEPGDVAITLSAGAGAVGVPSTLRAIGYVECDASFLDLANGFSHVAVRVTNSAAMQTGAVLIRGEGRYSPTQYVAAAKTDVAV
jgi:hypothetical protein